MARIGEAEVCSDGVPSDGPCDATSPNGACYKNCIGRHPRGQANCVGNFCQCVYECPPFMKCNVGFGRCTAACDEKCCNSKCAKAHVLGVGICDDSLGKQNSLCQCQYPC